MFVEEPTIEETVQILQGLRDRYEAHHRVVITNEALLASARLASRYIQDRFLPDKAIDLIDEAAARIKILHNTTPPQVKGLEDELSEVRNNKNAAVMSQDYTNAAELREKEIAIETRMREESEKWRNSAESRELVIGEDEISEIVFMWTSIPVARLREEETSRLLGMDEAIKKRIVGQDIAVRSIAKAIQRARVGLKEADRPMGCFFFAGPTGTGKTELAKALAEFLFGDEDSIVRIDMSEYMEKASVSRLVGAPPGYVGFEEGGQLSDAVRRKPYSVVLLDEIEKAHHEVFSILLQVMEDGRLTDSHGRKVSFKNAIVIMTTNVGSDIVRSEDGVGFKTEHRLHPGVNKEAMEKEYEGMKERILKELKKGFRPEFLNRVDEFLVFRSLDKEDIEKITRLFVDKVAARVEAKGLKLLVEDEVIKELAVKGFDPANGARPCRRLVQQYVEDPLSENLLLNKHVEGETIVVKWNASEDGVNVSQIMPAGEAEPVEPVVLD